MDEALADLPTDLVARVLLEHDHVVLWPPACLHPRVGKTIRNPDLPPLLMQAHLFAGTWVEGRRDYHRGLEEQMQQQALSQIFRSHPLLESEVGGSGQASRILKRTEPLVLCPQPWI